MTYEEAHRLFIYHPSTGLLYRRLKSGHIKEAGSVEACGRYRRVRVGGKEYRAHHIVWLMHTGRWPTSELDHINRNGLDNRLLNLRESSRAENCLNRSCQPYSISGIHWDTDRDLWRARINGRCLGRFNNFLDAVAARKSAELI